MKNQIVILVFVACVAFSFCKPQIGGDENLFKLIKYEVSSLHNLDETIEDKVNEKEVAESALNVLGESEILTNFAYFKTSLLVKSTGLLFT